MKIQNRKCVLVQIVKQDEIEKKKFEISLNANLSECLQKKKKKNYFQSENVRFYFIFYLSLEHLLKLMARNGNSNEHN